MRRPGVSFGLALMLAFVPAGIHAATTVFVNRCAAGCQFSQGPDNSVANTSTLLTGTRTLAAFQHPDPAFDAVVACLTGILAPFDFVLTTTDPSPAPHTELAIAGTPTQAGFAMGISGVAPFTCNVVRDAPAFVFANILGNDPTFICHVAAAQLGSLAGLEPLFNCPDVMSYLDMCGPKTFRNEESPCGTFQAAPCMCGGTTRNSFAVMRGAFGGPDALFADGFED